MTLSFQQKPNIQDFEAFTKLPENSEKIFELIDGEIFEVPSNPYVSVIASRIIGFILI